jgi:hypothetical protein
LKTRNLKNKQIASDISDTFSEVLDLFYRLLNSLPSFEIYVELFESSRIQMLMDPLTDLFREFTHVALLAIRLYDRSPARKILLISSTPHQLISRSRDDLAFDVDLTAWRV